MLGESGGHFGGQYRFVTETDFELGRRLPGPAGLEDQRSLLTRAEGEFGLAGGPHPTSQAATFGREPAEAVRHSGSRGLADEPADRPRRSTSPRREVVSDRSGEVAQVRGVRGL